MPSSVNMLATGTMWIRAVSYSHTHTNAPWIVAHIPKLQLTRGVLSTNVAKRAAVARSSMRTLPTVSPAKVLGTGVAWICTVSYPHTHRHARCTLLTYPKIHLSAGCLGMCMPKRAGTAQASVCSLPPVSSVMEPDAGVARMCTPYLPARAPSCTKRTTRKLNNPSDHGWFENMAA